MWAKACCCVYRHGMRPIPPCCSQTASSRPTSVSGASRCARRPGNILALWLHYIALLLVFWLVTSFALVNAQRPRADEKKPWVNTAMCVVVNIGLIGLCAVQFFFVLFTTGVAASYEPRVGEHLPHHPVHPP